MRSLLAQTFSDWVCELHNDAPDDPAPRAVLEELAPGDSRFEFRQHAHNWGAVATFNHAFTGGPETCASLLEDDNWWEPTFLETALATLDAHPEAALVWSNMRVWSEQNDGSWLDTGRTIWNAGAGTPAMREFRWPELLQGFDALHSQGAMIFRPARFSARAVPPSTPLAIVEPMRERAANGPLLLLTAPLANFAHTRGTARDANPTRWLQAKLLLAASFFSAVRVDDNALARMWEIRRNLRPPDTGIFFCVALLLRSGRFVRAARWRDWCHFVLGGLRHPKALLAGLRCREAFPEAWAWLTRHSQPAHEPASATLFSKDVAPSMTMLRDGSPENGVGR